jgi:hypothetical protein
MLGFGLVIYQKQYTYAQPLCDTMRNDLRNTLRASLGTLDFGKKNSQHHHHLGNHVFISDLG